MAECRDDCTMHGSTQCVTRHLATGTVVVVGFFFGPILNEISEKSVSHNEIMSFSFRNYSLGAGTHTHTLAACKLIAHSNRRSLRTARARPHRLIDSRVETSAPKRRCGQSNNTLLFS